MTRLHTASTQIVVYYRAMSCYNGGMFNGAHKTENEKRFWKNIPIRNTNDEGCWIWCGPFFNRTRRYVEDRPRPYFYARNMEGNLLKVYANHFAWDMYTGIELRKGEWLAKDPSCVEPMCVSPHCHKVTDAAGFYREKFGRPTDRKSPMTEEDFLKG